ncbi:MAG: hypothetical protein WD492_08265 [Alkalispirochaeta sp.]
MLLIVPLAVAVGQESTTDQESNGEESTEAPAEGGTTGADFGVGLQSIQLDGETWTRLHFFPTVPIGRLRLALDMELFFNNEGEVSAKGWDFSSRDATLDSLSRKIYFVAWNRKQNVTDGDDYFYARLGALDGVTLGDGIVMNNYRNTLDYPVIKQTGLDIAVGNITDMNIGFEGMVGDITDFSRGGGLVGGRLFFSPLGATETPILKNLQFGVFGAYDINQYGGLRDSDGDDYPDGVDRFPNDANYQFDTDGDGVPDSLDPDRDGDNVPEFLDLTDSQEADLESILGPDNVAFDFEQESLFNLEGKQDSFGMVGADVRLPILPFLSLYAQTAMSVDPAQSDDEEQARGFGVSAPGIFLDFLPILSADIGYRYRQGEFRFGYFGENYGGERAVVQEDGSVLTKDSQLTAGTLNGVYGSLSANLYIINVYGSYEYLIPLDGDVEDSISLEARAGVNRERLAQIPVLSNYLAGFSAYYLYENKIRLDFA